ncbi:MAG: hypothetical protein D6767_09730 [Candidatus Hydrogenedentota bacterium]|nr:MAG: hypothetical protein D6767_09730 [Candidatus Hydrogenedentota bacterium]
MKKLVSMLIGIAFTLSLSAKEIGKVALAIGKVQIKTPGGTWQKAKPGMVVTDKTQINTGFKSKAVVKLNTGSRLLIKPSTVMSFAKFVKGSFGTATDVNLRLGGVTAMVSKIRGKQKNFFRVRTPTAVAGVRGTIQDVSFTPDRGTQVQLLESSAQVINQFGIQTEVPQGGTAQAPPSGEMVFPDQMAEQSSNVFLTDPSMGEGERDFMMDAFDPMFGGSPNDFFFLQDAALEQFFIFDIETVDFEKL